MARFLETNYIKSNTLLDKTIDDTLIIRMLETAQDCHLERILGQTLFEKLEYNFDNNILTVKQTFLIEQRITKYLLSTIEYLANTDMVAKYSNSGVYVLTPNNTQQMSLENARAKLNLSDMQMHTYENKIIKYIEENILDFPEYESNLGIKPVKTRSFGMYIDDSIEERTSWDNNTYNRNGESL